MKPQIKIKKICENAVLPTYGSEFSAGADLYACIDDTVKFAPGETKFIHTGICAEIPVGYVGLVFARSSISCKRGLAPANKVGVIDSDYRGEIICAIHNQSGKHQEIEPSERIAQLVIMPYLSAQFVEADELSDTVRGEGGFGSTGRK